MLSFGLYLHGIDFKTQAVKRDKEGHYIMIKGSIQEEDITIINIYAPNIGAPQYVRQMLTSRGEINNNKIVAGDFNTSVTPMDRSTKQKISKETQTLNDTMDQFSSVQFTSVTQSCPTICNPMNCSTPGLPVHHQLPEFTQTHVH